jgi:hypothetical protein
MCLAKNDKEALGSKEGRKLIENPRGFSSTPTILFLEFVRQLKVMHITIKEEKYI